MNAIPQCYSVVVEVDGRNTVPVTEGVLGELVSIGDPVVTESGTSRVVVNVAARTESDARSRAEKVTQGAVLEVSKPSPLQHFAKQKALPHRRSFIMTRYKRGRYNQQGGSGSYQPPAASSAGAMQSQGVGLPVGESVAILMGPEPSLDESPVTEAGEPFRMASMKAEFKTQPEEPMPKPTSPPVESVETPSLESLLSGYPQATKLHQKLSKTPVEWLESNRGRKIVVDAIHDIRLREGNAPADALESTYVDGIRPHDSLHES